MGEVHVALVMHPRDLDINMNMDDTFLVGNQQQQQAEQTGYDDILFSHDEKA